MLTNWESLLSPSTRWDHLPKFHQPQIVLLAVTYCLHYQNKRQQKSQHIISSVTEADQEHRKKSQKSTKRSHQVVSRPWETHLHLRRKGIRKKRRKGKDLPLNLKEDATSRAIWTSRLKSWTTCLIQWTTVKLCPSHSSTNTCKRPKKASCNTHQTRTRHMSSIVFQLQW